MPQLPNPPMPHISGSTTPCTNAHAIAASTALPPALRISAPASVDSGWAATIIAFPGYRMGLLLVEGYASVADAARGGEAGRADFAGTSPRGAAIMRRGLRHA